MITFKELSEKVVNIAQRKKMARRMSKLQKSAGFQLKKKRNSLRVRDTAKLTVIAKKKVTQIYRDKFYKNYKDLPVQLRVKADQLIQQKYGPGIAKKVIKMMPNLKAAEKERVKAARDAYGKDE
tara:strand:- start:71 stop:442 length:372 start_codon:yes stop_codon:yes gene_type:complete